jgi:glyoxylase-like metal-dependent hydrolase (beta-lactamase superfamily II)
MIQLQAGEIAPGLHALGVMAIPAYLLDGPEPVIFDAGISALGPAYLRHARQILGSKQPKRLFLSHAHFDHCGAAAQLAEAFPGLKICASKRAADIVSRPNALKLISQLNEHAASLARGLDQEVTNPVPFESFSVDQVLADGDEVELEGGETIQILASPGHTWDMLSFYIPQRGILIASEAVGCPTKEGRIITEFLVDYDAYLASLRRLAQLPVEVLCMAHYSALTGIDSRNYFDRALAAAQEFKTWVEDLLRREGDVSRVVQLVKASEWDPRSQPKQPEPAYLLNLQARVQHLADKMAEQSQ